MKETRLVRLMNEIYDARHEDGSSSSDNYVRDYKLSFNVDFGSIF